MKIRYIKHYTDEHNTTFLPGWVAEHSQSDCEKRVALGVAIYAEEGTRALRYSASAPVLVDACAAPEPAESPFKQVEEQQEERKGPKVFKTK